MARPQSLVPLLFFVAAAWPISAVSDGHVTVSHGISAFGDLKYAPDFAAFEYVNPDAPQGGTMSFRGALASQTFDSLNDFILTGEPAQGLPRLYDTLMVRAYDEPDAVYGQIAETVELPEDRSWAIFNLRPEARFTDGVPLTAEDVVWTFETLKAEGSPRYQIRLKDLVGIEALGPHRVKFTFADDVPTRDLASDVAQIAILPKHYYGEVDFTRSTLEPPVGSGKYVVSDVDAGRSVTYCQVEDYWGADLPVNQGTDNFECFRYEYFLDNTASFEALKSGEYLFHEEFTSATWATAYDFPALDRGWVVQDVISDGRPAGTQGFWFNMRRPQFQDIRVREAIAILFNFEWTNATLFYGLYNRTDSFWENSPMEAEGPPEGAELAVLEPYRAELPEEVFTGAAYVPPISADQPSDRRAIRQAQALLSEAGWEIGDDGMARNAEGKTLELAFLSSSASLERIILPFIENLRRAGVDARFDLIDRAQYEERRQDFDFDMTIARFSMPASPSIELRQLFGSESADQPGTFNLSGLQDPVVDALIDEVIAAETRAELDVRVKALDRVLRAKHIWAPNWTKGSHWLAFWDVFGRPDVKPPYVRGADYWWFDQAKYDALREQGALR
ncbi:MAG: extracellular solute-binding protein [Pseudomonadota bacterium]